MLSAKTRSSVIAGLAAAAALTTTGAASAAVVQRTIPSPVAAGSANVTTADKAGGSGQKLGLTCKQAILVATVYKSIGDVQTAAGSSAGAAASYGTADGVLQGACTPQ